VDILVCVKRVPTVGGKITVTDDGQEVDTRMSGFTISPHEECAVEEAVRITERLGGTVSVLTLGAEVAVEQLRDALALGRDDPAVARLNPSACLDDAEVDAEFHRLMDGDLNDGRLEALAAFEKTVDNDRLDEEEALAWMRAINDTRLLLGTRLSVGEDPAERTVAPDDPRAPGFALYDYLSLLTQELVEALDT